ncbi:hypothetical protein HK104_009383 [Borealophlyctis nickersoniae]|nr:hypothetical protein HK104_009383 [Borealophlyctis nickersoniae]
MDDAATIISTCSRLLSTLPTVTEADARAAGAACEAWLKEHYPQLQHAVVSRRARRLPPEILNKIFRLLPYDYNQKAVLLACSSVNREWRRHGWPLVWREFQVRKPLAATACQFLLPWALEAAKGIHVRDLVVARTQDSLDYLPLLLAAPIFTGLRCLSFYDVNPSHLLVAFRSLPNLTYLELRWPIDERVAGGSDLGWTEQEENETWANGLGNLKALYMVLSTDDIMLEKLAMGLGSRLESLRIFLYNAGGEVDWERQLVFDQFLSAVSQNCPNLADFELRADEPELDAWMIGSPSIQRFFTTQQQLVSLSLQQINVSDDMIRTVAASCVNLKILDVHEGDDVTSQCFQHLASAPFLQALAIHDFSGKRWAKDAIVDFLRHRGRDLEYLRLPNDSYPALAPFIDLLPNIRYLSVYSNYFPGDKEDVIAFLSGARKLERLWIGSPGSKVPDQIREVAIARKVELAADEFKLPDYVAVKKERWMGV